MSLRARRFLSPEMRARLTMTVIVNQMQIHPHGLRNWGLGAALVAAVFAVWMLFFPDLAISFFAWPVEPRQAQIFIGAGYIFRTGFFLTVALTPAWHR